MSTIVVNLFGAPGAGKSTGAAYIFYCLKAAGINAELVTEFAKDKVWEKNEKVFINQAYIFGKQSYRQTRLLNEVDVIVTDSPVFLSIYYNNSNILGEDFNRVVYNVFESFNNMNYFIKRTKPYNPKGRFQDEQGSDNISTDLEKLLTSYDICYRTIDGDKAGYDTIVKELIEKLCARGIRYEY